MLPAPSDQLMPRNRTHSIEKKPRGFWVSLECMAEGKQQEEGGQGPADLVLGLASDEVPGVRDHKRTPELPGQLVCILDAGNDVLFRRQPGEKQGQKGRQSSAALSGGQRGSESRSKGGRRRRGRESWQHQEPLNSNVHSHCAHGRPRWGIHLLHRQRGGGGEGGLRDPQPPTAELCYLIRRNLFKLETELMGQSDLLPCHSRTGGRELQKG